MLLKVENLNIFRGYVHACVDVSFEAEKGEAVGIVGPNGAGKTTLIQGLMGLIPVKSGHIYYNNLEITNLPPYKIAKLGIGYVPEDRRLFGELTVKENILISCWARKIKKEELEVFKELFPKIEELYNKKSIYCSGGEQMITAVFRALSFKPTLLLLDECFEGLAPIARKSIKEYLIREKKNGLTTVLTESNPNYLTWVDKLY
ncbi:MAG: ATP-binding cassette domain-containing protein [Candidatus Bathyarchaeia archaeon]